MANLTTNDLARDLEVARKPETTISPMKGAALPVVVRSAGAKAQLSLQDEKGERSETPYTLRWCHHHVRRSQKARSSNLSTSRHQAGLTQRELAGRLELQEQQIQRYEANDYASANFERLREIAGAIGVRCEALSVEIASR